MVSFELQPLIRHICPCFRQCLQSTSQALGIVVMDGGIQGKYKSKTKPQPLQGLRLQPRGKTETGSLSSFLSLRLSVSTQV